MLPAQPQQPADSNYCSMQLKPDLSEAEKFLSYLSGTKDITETIFTFQTFSDREELKNENYDPNAKVIIGTLALHAGTLAELNQKGVGVFVTINETDGMGRKKDNIIKVRANFADLDGAPLGPVEKHSLKPHIINETSPGKYHVYYIAEGVPLEEFSNIQKGTFYGTDTERKSDCAVSF